MSGVMSLGASLAPANILWVFGGLFGLLAGASVTITGLLRRRPEFAELVQRLKTWWVVAAVFLGAFLAGELALIGTVALIAFLALREYLSIVPTRRVDRRVLALAYLALPVQFFFVAMGWYGIFAVFVPVYLLVLIPVAQVLTGEPRGFVHAAGTLHWGVMITLFALGHAAFLVMLPASAGLTDGLAETGAGLLLFLLIVVQLNDVAQYVWGKLIGGAKVLPRVSPGKTWAGLLGGIATSAAVATGLAPLLTPFGFLEALGIGAVLALAGFLGDVTMSAIKRDIGIKDAGALLPGHGGVLDRVDSLIFAAPLFFHFTRFFHYGS